MSATVSAARVVVLAAVLALGLLAVGAIWTNAFTIGDRVRECRPQDRAADRSATGPRDRGRGSRHAPSRSTSRPQRRTRRRRPRLPLAIRRRRPDANANPEARAGQGRRQPAAEPRCRVHLAGPQGLVRGRGHPDGPRTARRGGPDRCRPAQARRADRRVGEPSRQPQRRLGPRGDGGRHCEAYGVDGYEVRAYETRAQALRDAAKAISRFHAPVILLAWRAPIPGS